MRSQLDRALVTLAREPRRRHDNIETVIAAAPRQLGEIVVNHGIAGLAYRHVRHLDDVFPELVAALDGARTEAWLRHLITMADLAKVAAAFAGMDGKWAVVKGPVLAVLAYGAPDLRLYLDLDILVHPAAYGEALDRLEAAGIVLLDRNWDLIRNSMRAELTLQVAGRTMIDLHWHLLNEREWRRRTSWDMGQLLARAHAADIDGQSVPILEPTDAIVHVATHACLAGAHRMIWLKDIERQLSAFPVPFDLVEERAREAGLWSHVSLAVTRAARTFEFPRPTRTPAWTRLDRLLGYGRFRVERGPLGRGQTLAGATRATFLGSVGAVAGAGLRHELGLFRESRDARRGLPPALPGWELLRKEAGSSTDRQRYLAAVAAE